MISYILPSGSGTTPETTDVSPNDSNNAEADAFRQSLAYCDGGAANGPAPFSVRPGWGSPQFPTSACPNPFNTSTPPGSAPISSPFVPAVIAAPQGSVSPSSPATTLEAVLYQKISNDVNATGTDKQTLEADAAKLAAVAGGNGDMGLERVARNIGNSLNNGSYGQAGSSNALAAAAPGTAGAVAVPTITSNPNALGAAFIRLEQDVDRGPRTSGATLMSDANLVKLLAASSGETGLAAAANNIAASLDDGSYDQLKSTAALQQNPAKNSDLV